jgi:hypothetical protein
MILIGEFNQIFNFTFSAALAVSDIPCDLDLAVKILNAVGKEDQKFIGPYPVPVGSDKMVVQLDERLLDFVFRYPDDLSHQDHQGEKDFGDEASQLMREEDVLPSEYGEDKEQTENRREGGMNVFQPDHGNIPEEKNENEQNNTGKD